MIVRISFKTPDAMEDAIQEAIQFAEEDAKETGETVDTDELREKAEAVCKKWIKFGENITVDVDTENGTCTVEPV
jgi:hypothetical protein